MSDLGGGPLPPPSGPPLPGPGIPGRPSRRAERERRAARSSRTPRAGGPSIRVLAIGALAVLVTAIVLTRTVARDGADTASHATTVASSVAPSVTAPTTTPAPTTAPRATPPSTTASPPTTTVADTTTPAPTATTAPPATEASTAAPTETTAEPATTEAPPTTAADGRAVVITSRVEPCRFGPRCLVAGFRLEGFGSPPATFTCEFANGTRRTFPLGLTRVRQACTTGKVPDSITIEVAGVRSETVTIS